MLFCKNRSFLDYCQNAKCPKKSYIKVNKGIFYFEGSYQQSSDFGRVLESFSSNSYISCLSNKIWNYIKQIALNIKNVNSRTALHILLEIDKSESEIKNELKPKNRCFFNVSFFTFFNEAFISFTTYLTHILSTHSLLAWS